MTPVFQQIYLRNILRTLAEKTQELNIDLKPAPKESTNTVEADVHRFRLNALLQQVMRMAGKAYYKVPESCRNEEELDDWTQYAMNLVLELTPDYDADRGVAYQNYITSVLNLRLIDKQRSAYRTNPAVEAVVANPEGQTSKSPESKDTTKEGSDHSGSRTLVRPDNFDQIQNQTHRTPDREFLQRRLWDCVDGLEDVPQAIFVGHELDQESFPSLYQQYGKIFGSKSQRSFERHYYERVFATVQQCVEQPLAPIENKE